MVCKEIVYFSNFHINPINFFHLWLIVDGNLGVNTKLEFSKSFSATHFCSLFQNYKKTHILFLQIRLLNLYEIKEIIEWSYKKDSKQTFMKNPYLT